MAATKRQFNWTSVSFGGTTITGVSSVEIDPQGQLEAFSGDADQGPTTIVLSFIDNLITIVAADILALRGIDPGDRGSFSATHNDAKAATGGDLTYAITNQGIAVNNPTGGAHRQFGSGRLILRAEWADGTTNPLSSSAA